jgi:hypothetical protein
MVELDPSCRPTNVAVLNYIRAYHEGFTRAQLKGPVPEPNLDTMKLEERFKQIREANVRQAAREQKRLEAELSQTVSHSTD